MSSAAHAIADFLASRSVAVRAASTGWALNVSLEPPTPPNCVTVYDTDGDEWDTDELDMTTFSVQVRIRAVSYIDACAKCNEISSALRRASFTFESLRFYSIRQLGGLQHIGFDDQSRTLITMNFDCMVQEVA